MPQAHIFLHYSGTHMKDIYKRLLNKQFHSLGKCDNCDFESIEEEYSVHLPTEYKELMRLSNGGERQFANTYLSLWQVEKIIELNRSYKVQHYLSKKLICFGNDGDLGWVFDFRGSETEPAVALVSLGDLDVHSIRPVAETFSEFLNKLVDDEIDTYS